MKTVDSIGKTKTVAGGECEHAINGGEWDVVTDAAVAALAFESQEDGLGEACEGHAVGQVLKISDAEANCGIGEGDPASLDYREIGARAQPGGSVRRTRDVANYRSGRKRRFVEDRTARGGRGHRDLARGQRSQIRSDCDARVRIAFEFAGETEQAFGVSRWISNQHETTRAFAGEETRA